MQINSVYFPLKAEKCLLLYNHNTSHHCEMAWKRANKLVIARLRCGEGNRIGFPRTKKFGGSKHFVHARLREDWWHLHLIP